MGRRYPASEAEADVLRRNAVDLYWYLSRNAAYWADRNTNRGQLVQATRRVLRSLRRQMRKQRGSGDAPPEGAAK